MNRRKAMMLFSTAAAIGLASGYGARRALACGPEAEFTKPIKFEPGRNSAEIKRSIKGDYTHEWVVSGKPGQVIQVSIESKKSTVTVMPGKEKGAWGDPEKGGSGVKTFVGKIPASGRMMIEVSTGASKDSYVLGVTLI